VDTPDKGRIHIPSGMEWEGVKFHATTQNNVKFKTSSLFISGIFHLIFLLTPQLTAGFQNHGK
jgi:hypothetical protein